MFTHFFRLIRSDAVSDRGASYSLATQYLRRARNFHCCRKALAHSIPQPHPYECFIRKTRTNEFGLYTCVRTFSVSTSTLENAVKKRPSRLAAISKHILTISDTAADRIKVLLENERKRVESNSQDSVGAKRDVANGNSTATAVKIGLKRHGCNGLSYTMVFANEHSIKELDEVIREKGVTVIVDYKAVMYLIGTKMDFLESELSSEFIFHNPNKKSECGCGKSFST